ncbi:MAG TPA: hypothetical protein VF510_01655 [Ktedonobacterales bacterium]
MKNSTTRGLVAALALTALLLTGCASLTHATTASPTRQSTSKAGLTWQQVTPPQGFSLKQATITVSPVDGHDAWVCVPATTGSFTIWATKDAGASWQQISRLTPATPEPARTCNLVADQYDTQSLVAVFSWGAGEDGSLRSMSYFSSDGGAHMRALEGKMQTLEVGNASGATFAIMLDTDTTRGLQLAVIIGDSALLKWRAISPPGLAPNDGIANFWTHLPDGTLFVATAQNAFWRSADGGTKWTRVSTVPGHVTLGAWLPRQGRWMFCASAADFHVACSADDGASWHPLPALDAAQQCPVTILSPDGSALASCPAGGSGTGATSFTLYRLALGAASWSIVGTAPSDSITMTATGQKWAINGQAGTISVADMPL